MKTASAIVITVGMILGAAAAQAGTQFDPTTVARPFRETSVISCEAKLAAQSKENAKLKCEVEYLECLEAGEKVGDCKAAELLCKLKVAQDGQKHGDETVYEADGTSGTFLIPSKIAGKKLIENGAIKFDLDDDNGGPYIKSDQIIRTVSCEARLKGAEEHFQSLHQKIEDLKTSGEGR